MAQAPKPTAIKATAAIVGLLSLVVLIQAFTGGLISRETGRGGFVNAHQGLAYLTAVLALAMAVVAFMMWRGLAGGQVVLAESVALLVLVIIQIGIGQQIGDLNKKGTHPGLLAIHIPVALLIFGVGLHLSTYVSNLRRGGA